MGMLDQPDPAPPTMAPTGAPPGAAPNLKNQVQSVAKAFGVLACFTPATPALSIAEVAARTGLDRGTSFRLIHTLVGLGYLRPVAGERRFRLTLKCLELGFAALATDDLPAHALPLLRDLVPEVADAASLGVVDRGEVIYLARAEVPGFGRFGPTRPPGSRIGAYATALGQAFLAWLPRAEQIAHLEAVPRITLSTQTLTALDTLLDRLEVVRTRGFAVSDGENAYGLVTVATPVFDGTGLPCAAVSLTVDGRRMAAATFCETAVVAARSLAGTLGDAMRQSFGAIRVRPVGR